MSKDKKADLMFEKLYNQNHLSTKDKSNVFENILPTLYNQIVKIWKQIIC